MTSATDERAALELFESLLDVPEADRERWLAARSPSPEVLSRLEALRAAIFQSEIATGGALSALDEEPPPERLGAYAIVGLIGRGGMGSVYLGQRATGDFAHAVAIKIIKPGLLSDALIERFQHERQILARLTHPNIARLYDGGATAAGSPYIVMEYVDGRPLDQWVGDTAPEAAVRFRIFLDICGAVAFANRNLIVHRDVTPGNVLITPEGVAKLIDFGISRNVDHQATPSDNAAPSHTPGFAAPERLAGVEVSTATDVFSLGRLLEAMVRPGPADRELRAIIDKATAPRPDDRYATADALHDDVVALRSGRPVKAMPSSGTYLLRKFIGRHPFATAGAAGTVLLLSAGLAVTLTAYAVAEQARRAEAARFDEVRSLASFMLFDLNASMDRIAGTTAARAAVARRAQHYLAALARSPEASPDLKLEAAKGFVALARTQGVPAQPNLGDTPQAKTNLETAIAMLRDPQLTASPNARPVLIEALTSLALVQAHADGDTPAAGQSLAKAEQILALAPKFPESAWREARRSFRRAQLEIATLENDPDRLDRLALALEGDQTGWPPSERRSQAAMLDQAYADYYRASAGYLRDDFNGGLVAARRADRRFKQLDTGSRGDPVVLYARAWNAYLGYGLASGLPDGEAEMDRFRSDAQATLDRLLAIESDDAALKSFAGNMRQIHAQAMSLKGRHAEALAIQAEALDFYESGLGPERSSGRLSRLAIAYHVMGNIADEAGQQGRACVHHRQAKTLIDELAARRELIGYLADLSPDVAASVANCGASATRRPPP
ncbi:serine/threonine-protein kinase [Brevundimonas sp.]|uniref:serine/threonine-protein kinase n=1 Tax=Brevundimonas sp. TaxID=1871086 RepID=UPI0035B2955D